MNNNENACPRCHAERHPSTLVSILLFVAAMAGMAAIRFVWLPGYIVSLTYGLPLLICLWHRDRRLLWAMAAGFTVMSVFKMLDLSGERLRWPALGLQWAFQVTNIAVIAAAVHLILSLTAQLKRRNADLELANEQLAARQEEILRQNEELQAQAEELAQQNEELQQQQEELARQTQELQQQSEELEQQSEELRTQSEELQNANIEVTQREAMLQTMLESFHDAQNEEEMVQRICEAAVQLIGSPAAASAVVELEGDQMVVRTQAGPDGLRHERWPAEGSFASIVMRHEQTAFVDDLDARPDLKTGRPNNDLFRSVLATPLRINGRCSGVVKVYSRNPQQWTTHQFRVIEWVSAQCSLIIEMSRLRKHLTETNAHLESVVSTRTKELQDMVNELEHFSYTITHDMRAPLRAMQGFAAILGELGGSGMNPDMKSCLDRIVTSATRMDRLITDALSYSKAVKQELTVAPVDPASLLQGIIYSYPDLQPPKAQILIEGLLPRVVANEAGLTQCFSNLLGNAVKFVTPGTLPQVRIRAEKTDGVVRLWFEDNGIGIPREMQPRIFQMFQRASKAHEGTGIGLALVRKVAARMGGRVGMESEPGKGSRFWLELPSADQPMPATSRN